MASIVAATEPLVKPFARMRSDVVDLGFSDFNHAFVPGLVIFLCKREDAIGELHIAFLHVDGMAHLVGLGLAWSYTILKDDALDIHVLQGEEDTWKEWWAECNKEHSSLVVVQRKDAMVHRHGSLAGLECLLSTINRRCWLQAFSDYVKQQYHSTPSGGGGYVGGMPSNSGTLGISMCDVVGNLESAGKRKSDCVTQMEQYEESRSGDCNQLNVIVHLATLGLNGQELQSVDGDLEHDDEAYLRGLKINATLTVRFFHQQPDYKFIEATILAEYQLDSWVPSTNVFGWYQNDLISSFGCVEKDKNWLVEDKFVGSLSALDDPFGTMALEGTAYMPLWVSQGDTISYRTLLAFPFPKELMWMDAGYDIARRAHMLSGVETKIMGKWELVSVEGCYDYELSIARTLRRWRSVDVEHTQAPPSSPLHSAPTRTEIQAFPSSSSSSCGRNLEAKQEQAVEVGKVLKQDTVIQTLCKQFRVNHGFTVGDYAPEDHVWELQGGLTIMLGSTSFKPVR